VKLTEATAGYTGSGIVGTPAYMSPEQAGGKPLDGRSDVYALAVILFQLLTSQLPFKSDTPIGQAVAHIVEPVPQILQFNSSLSPDTDAVVRTGLAKKPEDRYPTAGAFAAAVTRLSSGAAPAAPATQTILTATPAQPAAPAPPPAGLPARNKKVNPVAVASLAAMALLVISSACLGTVFAASRIFSLSTATPTASATYTASATVTASDTPTLRPSATGTATRTATQTPTDTPSATPTRTFVPFTRTPSATPLPSCNPPEFFDPFLNRCRMPDQTNPGDGGGGGGNPPPTATPCTDASGDDCEKPG
jgi:serine/threonine-protein kinase